jgi:hypothetical protein
MTLLKPVRFLTRLAAVASLAIVGLAQVPAHADTILLSDTTMVMGSSAADLSFTAPMAGTVTATLMNQSWNGGFSPLGSLSFMANSASGVLSSWSAAAPATTESFQVSGAGTYYAHVMASASGPADVGLYSLNLSFVPSAVPLPPSEWMLALGVLMLFGLTRALSATGSFERVRLSGAGA